MPKKAASSSKVRTSNVEESISLTPIPVTEGETITLTYDGMLAKNGAQTVYTHLGYGSNDSWSQIEDIQMRKVSKGWSCDILPKGGRINFCFHDGANNWDNNYGHNWSITIHDGN